MIFGVALPIVDIDLGQSGNEQFQLLLVEDCNKLGRDNVVET
jgi:hypothetical protein